jgi:hypothetical protein
VILSELVLLLGRPRGHGGPPGLLAQVGEVAPL